MRKTVSAERGFFDGALDLAFDVTLALTPTYLRSCAPIEQERRVLESDTGIRGCDHAEMHLYAAAARVRWGKLVGGDEGRSEVDRGTNFMTQEGVRSPERMTEMLIPGRFKA